MISHGPVILAAIKEQSLRPEFLGYGGSQLPEPLIAFWRAAARVPRGMPARSAVLSLALATSTAEAMAQELVIPDDPSPPCVIEFLPAGPDLSSEPDELLEDTWPGALSELESLSEGERLALVEGGNDRFFVVSRDGSGGRWVGRSGEGPGEYHVVRWVKPGDRYLHVFDPVLMRRTVLDPTTFKVVQTNRLGVGYFNFRFDALVLGDSSYVINGDLYTRERIGYVLHLLSGEGEVVRSFDEIPVAMPGQEKIRNGQRILSPARDGGVWSSWHTEYRIDLWDVESGTLGRTLVRDAPWFPPHSGNTEAHPERPDKPEIWAMMADSENRLWVLIQLASDRWSECWVKAPPGRHPEASEYERRPGCATAQHRLEVLDSENGSVLATHTGWMGRLTGEEAFSTVYDEYGLPTIRQWRPVLRPANGGQQCG